MESCHILFQAQVLHFHNKELVLSDSENSWLRLSMVNATVDMWRLVRMKTVLIYSGSSHFFLKKVPSSIKLVHKGQGLNKPFSLIC